MLNVSQTILEVCVDRYRQMHYPMGSHFNKWMTIKDRNSEIFCTSVLQ